MNAGAHVGRGRAIQDGRVLAILSSDIVSSKDFWCPLGEDISAKRPRPGLRGTGWAESEPGNGCGTPDQMCERPRERRDSYGGPGPGTAGGPGPGTAGGPGPGTPGGPGPGTPGGLGSRYPAGTRTPTPGREQGGSGSRYAGGVGVPVPSGYQDPNPWQGTGSQILLLIMLPFRSCTH